MKLIIVRNATNITDCQNNFWTNEPNNNLNEIQAIFCIIERERERKNNKIHQYIILYEIIN